MLKTIAILVSIVIIFVIILFIRKKNKKIFELKEIASRNEQEKIKLERLKRKEEEKKIREQKQLKIRYNSIKNNHSDVVKKMKQFENIIPSETYDYFKNISNHILDKKILSVCGLMNSGKSTFLNALMKDTSNSIFEPGDYRLTAEEQTEETEQYILIDAPGFDATSSDNDIAFNSYIKGDYHFFIHNITEGELTEPELSFLRKVNNYSNIDNRLMKTTLILTHIDESQRADVELVRSKIQDQLQNNFDSNNDLFCISSTDYIEGLANDEESLLENSNLNEVMNCMDNIYRLEDNSINTFSKHHEECLLKIRSYNNQNFKKLTDIENRHISLVEELKEIVKVGNKELDKEVNAFFSNEVTKEMVEIDKKISGCKKNIQNLEKYIEDEKDERREERRELNRCGLFELSDKRHHKEMIKINDDNISDYRYDIREKKSEISSYENRKEELKKLEIEAKKEFFESKHKKVNKSISTAIEKIKNNILISKIHFIVEEPNNILDIILNKITSTDKILECSINKNIITYSFNKSLTIQIKVRKSEIIKKNLSFWDYQNSSTLNYDGSELFSFIQEHLITGSDLIQMMDSINIKLNVPSVEIHAEYNEVQEKISKVQELLSVI